MYNDYNMYNNYYGFNNNYRVNNNSVMQEIISLNEAIDLIAKSIQDERKDEQFYDVLINQASTKEEKDIITSIRNDERKHREILRDIFYKLTGEMFPNESISNENINNTNTYKENLVKALFGELEAVKKYRKILGAMPKGDLYTLIMSIITDELIHANKYNYLIHISSK